MRQYKLTKVEATDPFSNIIKEGDSITGILFEDILEVGSRLMVQEGSHYISTSIVKEINNHPTDENIKVITTTYSIYHLELLQ